MAKDRLEAEGKSEKSKATRRTDDRAKRKKTKPFSSAILPFTHFPFDPVIPYPFSCF